MELYETIIFPDLVKLPRNKLENMATDLGLEVTGTVFDLARKIWDLSTRKPQKRNVFTKYSNILLAGRTSVSWFTCDNLEDLIDKIKEKEDINPFVERIPYEIDELDSTPRLRSALKINDNEYFLRFIYKDGTRRIIGEEIRVLPTTNTATVYIDDKKGIIEIRTKPSDAQKIAEIIAGYLNQNLSLNKEDFIKPFGYDLEKLAEKLEGTLIESKASPEMWLTPFISEENEAILEILKALDRYFKTEDIWELQEKLESSVAVLGEELTNIPFVAMVLAGMGNVGLKVDQDDLRSTPFYQLLRPYLQTSGGNIQFDVHVNGVEEQYKVQVGVDTKTVYFRSNTTTEEVIKFVRDRVINQ